MARGTKHYYKRLPGRGSRSVGGISLLNRARLWLGPDHVLLVESNFITEAYRRFYFADIQAIITRKTRVGRLRNWIFAVIALLTIAPAVFFAERIAWEAILFFVGGSALLFLLINAVLGPSCTVHVQTIQLEQLPALNRLRSARKALAQIQKRVEEVQGVISAETLAISSAAVTRPPAALAPSRPSRPQRHEHGGLHLSYFLTMITLGGCLLVSALHPVTALLLLSALLFIAGFFLVLFALGRQTASDLPVAVKALTWCGLGYFVLCSIIVTGYSFAYSIRNPEDMVMSARELLEQPGFIHVSVGAAGLALLIGAAGVWRIHHVRHRYATPPPLAVRSVDAGR